VSLTGSETSLKTKVRWSKSAYNWPSMFQAPSSFFSGRTAHTARNAKSPLFPGDRPGLTIAFRDGGSRTIENPFLAKFTNVNQSRFVNGPLASIAIDAQESHWLSFAEMNKSLFHRSTIGATALLRCTSTRTIQLRPRKPAPTRSQVRPVCDSRSMPRLSRSNAKPVRCMPSMLLAWAGRNQDSKFQQVIVQG